MARTTQVVLIDDVDGGLAHETLTFALDGVTYEIDLSRSNAARLRKALDPYVNSARRTGGRRTTKAVSASAPGKRRRTRGSISGRDIPAIRAWAKERGLLSTDRGRIPASVLAQYDAAHPSAHPSEPAPVHPGRTDGGTVSPFSGLDR